MSPSQSEQDFTPGPAVVASTPPPTGSASGALPQVLGRLEATTVVVGSMIGSGIFLKAAGMVQVLPHPGLLLLCWAAAGLLTVAGALVIAELSARFPGSGGLYLFLRNAFGPRVGFLFGWSLIAVLQTGSIASLATGLAQHLAPVWQLDASEQRWVAYAAIGALTSLHCVSVSLGARWVQNIVTFIKYFALLGLILLGLFGGHANPANLQSAQPLPSWTVLIAALGVIMLKALWAYDGWANATYIAGEVKDAQKNLPLALFTGTLLVMLIYVATNATYHLVLSPGELAKVASPAAGVAERCYGPGLAAATALLLSLSMLGTLNSSILSAPRVYFAMAQAGQFPSFMAAVNRFQTPYVSLILQGIWSACLVVLWGSFEKISDNVVFVYWIFYALSVLAALRFPPPEQGYRAPYRGLLATVFLGGALMVIGSQLVQQPASALQALGLLGVGLFFYRPDSSPSRESDIK
jgi:basic amino acid/polyamine antiporter, APA family